MSKTNNFTAHNVLLPNGSLTISKTKGLIADSPQTKAALSVLQNFFSDPAKTTISDLGCLEGGFSVEFARKGYRATGIEVRKANFENCKLLQEKLQLPNLNFVHDDVRNLAQYGPFDATFYCGLLYHLDKPAEFLKIISNQTKKVLILQTHYALLDDPLYDSWTLQMLARVVARLGRPIKKVNYKLSKLQKNEGKRGRWFPEFVEGSSLDQQEGWFWSSWKNSKSFWMVKEDLLQTLQEAGFDQVFEQFDCLGDIGANDYTARHDRGTFVAIKSGSQNQHALR